MQRRHFLAALGLAAVPGWARAVSITPAAAHTAPTLEAAKALFPDAHSLPDQTILYVLGRSQPTDGYGGFFYLDAADRGSTFARDAMGFVDGAGRRWKRAWEGGPLRPEWFGAKGDGESDDSEAFAALFAFQNPFTPEGTVPVVYAELQARRYLANIEIPTPAVRGVSRLPTFGIKGGGINASMLIAADPNRPAVSMDGSKATSDQLLYLSDFSIHQQTTNRTPAVSMANWNRHQRPGGEIDSVLIRSNRYNRGGGCAVYIHRGNGYTIRNLETQNGHYMVDLLGCNNVQMYALNGRVGALGLCRIQNGANNACHGARVEDANNGFGTDAKALALIHLIDTRSAAFYSVTHESGDAIMASVFLEGTGAGQRGKDLACTGNTFVGCRFGSPNRTDIPTAVFREKGNCHGNKFDVAVGSWTGSKVPGAADILFEANESGAVPRAETYEIRAAVRGPSRPTIKGVENGPMNRIRVVDAVQKVLVSVDSGGDYKP